MSAPGPKAYLGPLYSHELGTPGKVAKICELCGNEPGKAHVEYLKEERTSHTVEGGHYIHQIHGRFCRTLGEKCLEAQRRDGNID